MEEVGTVHCDLNGYNILLLDGQSDEFVVVDLETARDDIVYGYDLQDALLGFLCCKAHVEALQDWCKANGFSVEEWHYGFPEKGVRPLEQLLESWHSAHV